MSLVRPPFNNLCELTILPDESYDILFEDYPSAKPVSICDDRKRKEKRPSKDSCDSSTSCVLLQPQPGQDAASSADSESSLGSDSACDQNLDDYDFLVENDYDAAPVDQSKITIKEGKVGDDMKDPAEGSESLKSSNASQPTRG